jgi:hypothetical protein
VPRKVDYYGVSIEVHYDPINELYYCGVIGHNQPTIWVGKTSSSVENAAKDDLNGYLDFCFDQGGGKTELEFDVQEAYATEWIIRTSGSENNANYFENQKNDHLENLEVERMIASLKETGQNDEELTDLCEGLEHVKERKADWSAQKQLLRQEFISMAKSSGHKKIRCGDIEILQVIKKEVENET